MKARATYSPGLLLAVCALALGCGCRRPSAPEPAAPAQRPSSEHEGPVSQDAEVEAMPVHELASGTTPHAKVDTDIEDAAVDGTAPEPQNDASSPTTHRPAPGDCKTTRARIEDALRRAARCDAHAQCAMVSFHWAFGPCGIALRKDALLGALGDEAARYAARCNPPQVRVRCPFHTGALCTRDRCRLASPEELEAARVEPARIGF